MSNFLLKAGLQRPFLDRKGFDREESHSPSSPQRREWYRTGFHSGPTPCIDKLDLQPFLAVKTSFLALGTDFHSKSLSLELSSSFLSLRKGHYFTQSMEFIFPAG